MATSRDTIELLIEVLGQEGLERLARAADRAQGATKKLADTYEVLDSKAGAYEVVGQKAEQTTTVLAQAQGVSVKALSKLAQSTDDATVRLDELVRKAVEATGAQRALGRALEGAGDGAAAVGKAADKLDRSDGIGGFARKYRTEILNLGRVSQDFAQGGIGGILNNIEGLLGRFPALAGLGTLLATGLWAGWPKIREFWDSFDAAVKLPQEGLKDFEEALGRSRKAVALLNAESNDRVAALVRERDALDQVIDRHNKQAEAVKKLRQLQPAGQAEREHERAENLQALVGGDQAALVDEVAQGFSTPGQRAGRQETRRQLESDIDTYERQLRGAKDPGRRAYLQKWIDRARRRLNSISATEAAEREKAEGVVAGAVVQGRESDLQEALRRLPASSRFRGALSGQTNAALDRAEDESQAFDSHIERVKENVREQKAKARLKAEVDDLVADYARTPDEFAQADREHAARPGAVRKAEQARLGAQADQLLANGPEIVGQAFGPQAAAMAAHAAPEEVHAMRERVMKDLADGQAPYQALLDAFREVATAAGRQAQQTRQFSGQLNGLRGHLQTTTQPFHDAVSY